ncbi:hypothetical protein IWQ60_001502 [Tieghemiomyces parasiticus]|uniref:DNA helicase n=1 Tax=Tieghemiomyces parasiticus TaxID=78921 RepID=A0A9W8AE31_9FUNG|nr:hypothetical protein IWQ60_001502 [Tieghemiomyces parasiticus]
MVSPWSFVCHHAALVDRERAEELETTSQVLQTWSPLQLQKLGFALIGLHVTGMRTGLGGRTLIDLETLYGGPLPPHQIRAGDIVSLEASHADQVNKTAKSASKSAVATENGVSRLVSGVVYRIREGKIIVSTADEIPAGWNDRCTIKRLANDVTYKRILMALATVAQKCPQVAAGSGTSGGGDSLVQKLRTGSSYPGDISTTLAGVLLGDREPTFTLPGPAGRTVAADRLTEDTLQSLDVEWLDPGLNASQKAAVRFALGADHLALVHGPPGTGKTYTLVEIIRQLIRDPDRRVLVCGPSNIAVDNLVERLARHRVPLVRLGHPARVLPSVVDHTLDVALKYSDQGKLIQDVRQEMDGILERIAKSKRRAEKFDLQRDLRELRKEFKVRERRAVTEYLQTCRVVLSTLNGAGSPQLDREIFDVVVIDEATQALEGECWIAALKGHRLILAGDHLQLPPTIKSATDFPIFRPPDKTDACKDGPPIATSSRLGGTLRLAGLDTTLFDRMLATYGAAVKRMLTVQYRMHKDIMHYSSQMLYGGQLTAHPSVASHLLIDLDDVKDTDVTRVPLLMIDTTGCSMLEQVEEVGETGGDIGRSSTTDSKRRGALAWLDTESKLNSDEAELVVKHLAALVNEGGLAPADIAVISPYNAQVRLLTTLLKSVYPDLEIGSIDGFQGREKEAIILSLVRSNDDGEIGFLADYRRLNVAITRPKRHLCIIGDSETLGKHNAFLRGLCEWVEESGEVQCAEYY